MARSKETFNKREKEKKRLKKQQEKREKMEERKANAQKVSSFEQMLAYVDENGNLSSTPPDPKKRKVLITRKEMSEGNHQTGVNETQRNTPM